MLFERLVVPIVMRGACAVMVTQQRLAVIGNPAHSHVTHASLPQVLYRQ